jgi:hypothetical protein
MLATNCDLWLARPCELATLVLDFVEQPHVLDRDRRLVREGRDQLDLLVGERLNGAARQDQHAGRSALAQHRHAEDCAHVGEPGSYSQPHLRICFGVHDMNGLALEYDPTGDRTAIRPERMLFHVLLLLRGEAVARDMMVGAVLGEPDGSPIRAAKACRRLGERVEHRLQIEGRAADDLEHVGRGSLLLQRFGELARACLHVVEQPHVLDRDRRLVREGTD